MSDTPIVVVNTLEAEIAVKNGHPVYAVTQVTRYAPVDWETSVTPVQTPPSVTPLSPPTGKTLIFDDDFASLDTSKWGLNWFNEGGTQNNVATYLSNVSSGPGGVSLKLSAPGVGSSISTNPHGGATTGFEFTYGYVEFEATFPDNDDWCAGWINGQNWPITGEFDIAEQMGGEISSNYHYALNGNSVADNDPNPVSGLLGTSHVYGLLWEPGSATFYFDGEVHRVITGPEITSDPQYLIFNHGAASSSDASGVGSEFVVKYVRVWQ